MSSLGFFGTLMPLLEDRFFAPPREKSFILVTTSSNESWSIGRLDAGIDVSAIGVIVVETFVREVGRITSTAVCSGASDHFELPNPPADENSGSADICSLESPDVVSADGVISFEVIDDWTCPFAAPPYWRRAAAPASFSDATFRMNAGTSHFEEVDAGMGLADEGDGSSTCRCGCSVVTSADGASWCAVVR